MQFIILYYDVEITGVCRLVDGNIIPTTFIHNQYLILMNGVHPILVPSAQKYIRYPVSNIPHYHDNKLYNHNMKKGARKTKRPNTPTLMEYFKSVQQPIKQQSNPNSLSRGGLSNNKRTVLKYTKPPKDSELKRHQIHSIIHTSNVQTLIDKSSPFYTFYRCIQEHAQIPTLALIQKFLKAHPLRPWAQKYTPRLIQELLDKQSAERVVKWIKTCTSYKNMGGVVDLQDSFLYDNSTSIREEEIKNILIRERWQLKALVLLGQEGVGKYSTVKCVTSSYNIKLHECTNEWNKTIYCKQLYESIKSHSLQKLQKPVDKNTIKNYFHPEEVSCGMCSKIHLIHEISQIYPQEKRPRFYENLGRFIDQSAVPVIITCSDSQIPKLPQFLQYDIIEMKEVDPKQVARLIWAVFHIQYNLGKWYKSELIKLDDLDSILLNYFESLMFVEVITLEQMEILVRMLGSRVDSILTFFQQYLLQNRESSITFQDVAGSVHRYSKDYSVDPNRGILLKAAEEAKSQQGKDISQYDFHKRVVDDLLDSVDLRGQLGSYEEINTEKERLKPIESWNKHRRIINLLARKASWKIGYPLKGTELRYLKLLQGKERRLRNRKKIEGQKVSFEKILDKYFKKSDVLYLLRAGIE